MRQFISMESAVQANLLANLVHWVSEAKREIGVEHLPFFLDTYSTSGHLTSGLRMTILRLSEVVGEQPKSEHLNGATAWSRLLLELHGIITGGGAPAGRVDGGQDGWRVGTVGEGDESDLLVSLPASCSRVP